MEKLIKQGCMTPAGMAKIEAAKENGSWALLSDVENLVVPADLQAALAARKEASANFSRMSPSDRKAYLYWLASVKRDDTRRRRIREIVARLAQNRKRSEP